MEYNEVKKRDLLASLKEKAFQSAPPDNSMIEEISIELRTIPIEDKYKFYDFVKDFLDEGFRLGLAQNNIKLDDYQKFNNEIENETVSKTGSEKVVVGDDETKLDIATEKIEINESFLTFEDLLEKMRLNLKDYFEFFKGYHVLKLQNDPTKKFKMIFLYDINYYYDLLRKKINSVLSDIEFVKIDDFINQIDYEVNYLCVVLLNTKPNDKSGLDKLIDDLSSIIDEFNDFDNYSFYKNKEGKIEYKRSNVKDDFLDEVEAVNKSFLSNTDLSFAEEKIIKKMCSVNTPLILYKVLAKGYSGAKVLEVRPKVSANFEIERKFIIKYDLLEKKKLKSEYVRLQTNLDTFHLKLS
jgi:hypothetical protein